MPLDEFLVAYEAAVDDMREAYRVAAYPVYLQHGKKGKKWTQFLNELGLGVRKKSNNAGRRRGASREQLDRIYKLAEDVRKADLGGRVDV
ncbi:hypothetical protein [Roseinatronobacter alkalisoli]|uniref:Transposase n=1 Tax=Roseinatronobacter alkalisoli TaxID=3028235 RepID=A0ABT5TFJ7_9RHOB|nr:hypothetical protein [Roseinatronobacter sp. HJB301]MDD7973445.1 hypothetical protein [Roseinatronobacter sp. HJB301]